MGDRNVGVTTSNVSQPLSPNFAYSMLMFENGAYVCLNVGPKFQSNPKIVPISLGYFEKLGIFKP